MKTLPASWFCSSNIYDLEKRAVFLKAWYLLGPVVRFEVENDVEYEFAGVEIVVHKIGLDEFEVRKKSDNALLTHFLTPTGLIFTTISDTAPPFEEFFPPSLLPLLAQHDFRRLPYRKSLKYPGNFNWKTMVDGYQECLHCQYTHREFSQIYPTHFYSVENNGNISRHIADPAKPNDGLFLFFFPICTLNLYGGGMSSFRVCPGPEAGQTRMEFDYYYMNAETGDDTGFESYFKFVRRVALEDFELCEVAQANLEKGIYCQGRLNSNKENGVYHYQQLVRQLVVDEFKAEEDARQIQHASEGSEGTQAAATMINVNVAPEVEVA